MSLFLTHSPMFFSIILVTVTFGLIKVKRRNFLTLIGLGICYPYLYYHVFYVHTAINLSEPVVFEAKVVQVYQNTQRRSVIKVDFISLNNVNLPFYKKQFGQISIYNHHFEVNKGDTLKAKAVFKPQTRNLNYFVIDKRFFDFLSQLTLKGYIDADKGLVLRRQHLIDNHLKRFINQSSYGWWFNALLLGDKSDMPKGVREQLKELGIAHLFAISGLHMAIVFSLGFYSAKLMMVLIKNRLKQSHNLNHYAMISGLLAAFSYYLLTQGSLSALRAFLMLLAFVMTYFFSGKYISLRTCALCFMMIIVTNPFYLLKPSLYFSFVAVLGIYFALKRMRHGHKWWFFVKLQCCITVMLIPVSWFYLSGFSWLGILVNLLFIPLFSVILLPLLVLVAMMAFLGWTGPIRMYDDYVVMPFVSILQTKYDVGWITLPWIEPLQALLLSLVIVFMLFPSYFKTLTVAPMMLLSMSLVTKPYDARVIIYDVGHGLAVSVDDGKEAFLYDTGAGFEGFSYLEHVIIPSLTAKAIRLKQVVISHQDNDHSGGLNYLINSQPEVIQNQHTFGKLSHCDFEKITINKIVFIKKWPNYSGMSAHNNDSCVIEVVIGQFKLLLPGDIHTEAEREILTSGLLQEVDVLLSPHHGSKTSSSTPFIKALKPTWVIHSVRRFDRWRLPNHDVVKRYGKIGAEQLTTRDGAIMILVDGDKYTIKQKKSSSRYWFLVN